MAISWPLGHELKTKDTLLAQILKVEEKKVIYGPGAEIWPFHHLMLRKWSMYYRKWEKMPISWPWAMSKKN